MNICIEMCLDSGVKDYMVLGFCKMPIISHIFDSMASFVLRCNCNICTLIKAFKVDKW